MSGLSATNANKSTIHESPKDHSINIDSAAPYFQGKPIDWKSHLIEQKTNYKYGNVFAASSRRPLLSREPPIGIDRDENKYKRRTPAEIFSRWSR